MVGDSSRRCLRCILTEGFPGIHLNGQGLCSLCQGLPPPGQEADARRGRLQEMEQSLAQTKGQGDYDGLVAFSGGKDSGYVLHWLSQKGLRLLAVTVDNGYISPQAWRNGRILTEACGADHLIFRPAPAVMRRIFQKSATERVHAPASVIRASAICTSCITVINHFLIKTAWQMGIPLIAGGYLEGQLPGGGENRAIHLGSLARANQAMQTRWRQVFGAMAEPLVRLPNGDLEGSRLTWINPIPLLAVTEAAILAALTPLGWQRPEDTGTHSSNCRLNDLGIYLHWHRHGFHPYLAELAAEVRHGRLDRQTAMDRCQSIPALDGELSSLMKELSIDAASV